MPADYRTLAPEFRPGGGKDPRWMDGVRNLLPTAKAVDPAIVRDLFAYYDAACVAAGFRGDTGPLPTLADSDGDDGA